MNAREEERKSKARITAAVRGVILDIVSDYYGSEEFGEDLKKLKPAERVSAMEKLAAYAIPKLQATTVDIGSDNAKTIEDRLLELSQL